MKKLILLILLTVSIAVSAQEATDSLSFIKPREGKSMVYIVRPGSEALLIKFSIYDGDTYLGKLGHGKYFAYECDPGNHVFIADSENTSYLEANLEEGKVYVIETKVQMGIMSARVSLEPMDKTHKKYAKQKEKLLKFIAKEKRTIAC